MVEEDIEDLASDIIEDVINLNLIKEESSWEDISRAEEFILKRIKNYFKNKSEGKK
jgi:hypothetical protein